MSFQFLYPNVLWTLLVLILPIIIHLFNFKRYKKVFFSNMKFLKNLSIENKRRSKLKKWLLLISRLSALGCLILAFAQPYISDEKNIKLSSAKNENISIYIDNSFSMNAETEDGNALEVAKNKAFELINSLPDYANIQIYHNNISSSSPDLTKQQAIAKIQEINPSPVPVHLSKLIKNIQLNHPEEINRLYVFSDFQKKQSDFENLSIDSLLLTTFIPLPVHSVNNLFVDSCWFESPSQTAGQPQELVVKIKNASNQAYKKIPIKLSINDSVKSVSSFDIEEKSTQILKLRYISNRPGIYNGKVEIDDYPISHDNSMYFSYSIKEKTNILCINNKIPNKYLNNLFSESAQFNFQNIEKSQVFNAGINSYQLIILNELEDIESGLSQILINFMLKGGQLFLIPSEHVSKSINQFLSDISAPTLMEIDTTKQRFSKIEVNSDLYKNVFVEIKNNARLPDAFKFYKLSPSKNKLSENLWISSGGESLLTRTRYGNGQFVLLSMNLNEQWTNLVTHPIFVPTMINLSNTSRSSAKLYNILGSKEPIRIYSFIDNDKHPYRIQNNGLKTDVIPEQQVNHIEKGMLLYTHDQIAKAGSYFITQNDSIVGSCSFNNSREESIPEFFTQADINAKIHELSLDISIITPDKMKLSEIYNEQKHGKQFWHFFILLSLLFLTAEIIIQKLNFSKQT